MGKEPESEPRAEKAKKVLRGRYMPFRDKSCNS